MWLTRVGGVPVAVTVALVSGKPGLSTDSQFESYCMAGLRPLMAAVRQTDAIIAVEGLIFATSTGCLGPCPEVGISALRAAAQR